MVLGSKIVTKSPFANNGAQNKGAGSTTMYLNSTAHASLQTTELEKRKKHLRY